MATRNMTCIVCPMGCQLTVEFENGEVKPMNIDFEAYNKEALSQFYNLFSK